MKDLLYYLPAKNRTFASIKETLEKHPEVKFVSVVAVDLGNNHTDERIPAAVFLEDVEGFLNTGVQTDGSSVVLPKIAEINNAKVDLIPDTDVKWIVDYNYSHLDPETQNPIGTLLIPATLIHEGKFVDSRSILKAAKENFTDALINVIEGNDSIAKELGVVAEDIDEVVLTSATELEFWVKTPEAKADEDSLSTSQVLKEQYWKRTVGPVRTAMEESVLQLDYYDFGAEMAHKEVGGVPAKLKGTNKYKHIMEQLEIDWKYASAIQTADHELFSRDIIADIFVKHGLEVTFQAKPIEGVAGSGEHHHIGAALKLKSGKLINLFAPQDMTKNFLNKIGYGAIMGLLKNYEVINPFVTSSNDAFRRLKPGFEAPVCTVTSLGHSPEVPSRNRTVLAGLVRDLDNPMSTRFELRAPNPNTNTYLTLAASYQCMLDGILAVAGSELTLDEIAKNFDKKAGEDVFYLEKDRQYRSEEDVFDDFTEEERNEIFGKPPKTVFENFMALVNNDAKKQALLNGDVFTDKIIESYKAAILASWTTELKSRLIPQNIDLVRNFKKLHKDTDITDLDVINWEKINGIRHSLMKDSLANKSLFTEIREAIDAEKYDIVSELQVQMDGCINVLKQLYSEYKLNLLDFE